MRKSVAVVLLAGGLAVALWARTPGDAPGSVEGSISDPRKMSNAQLDAEIKRALAKDGVYVPPSARSASVADARWVARTNAMACLTLRSIEAVQFLDALGGGKAVRNPQSDASQTDCIHVPAGGGVAVDDWGGGAGIATVRVRGDERRYMVASDLVPMSSR